VFTVAEVNSKLDQSREPSVRKVEKASVGSLNRENDGARLRDHEDECLKWGSILVIETRRI
jgi:hypothetical protein